MVWDQSTSAKLNLRFSLTGSFITSSPSRISQSLKQNPPSIRFEPWSDTTHTAVVSRSITSSSSPISLSVYT